MRRLYLDTFLLVAALVHESALALQVRRGAITPQESQEAWERFGVLREQRLNTLHLASFDRGLCKAAAHYQVAHEQLLI